MIKTCFIIMPIAESASYLHGHFKRVYEHIIKPAVTNAGFEPIRADDVLSTNYIAIDVIKKIIESDMAVCDISGRNPNVFYELGIRQSFNLPVTLMRDSITARAFDIQGFRDIEYDETLRIDNVEKVKSTLEETIKNTYESRDQEVNSLISLLGIHPAKISSNVEITKDTEIILNALDNFGSRLSNIEAFIPEKISQSITTKVSDPIGTWRTINPDEISRLQIGDFVQHPKFGTGIVSGRIDNSNNPIISVNFHHSGPKKLMAKYVSLKKMEGNIISNHNSK